MARMRGAWRPFLIAQVSPLGFGTVACCLLCHTAFATRPGAGAPSPTQHSPATIEMIELRRSDRKRNQTDFLGATETLRDGRRGTAGTSRARAAAIAAAYEPLAGLVQLGAVGAEGRVWVGEPGEDGGCSTTFHGRLGAGVTISIDAVPAVFRSGLLKQHPICRKLFSTGTGVQGNSNASTTAAAAAARIDKAVERVYERFETACDDLDSGLFDLAGRHCYCCMLFFAGAAKCENRAEDGHVWCMACSYQVHGKGGNGGQHPKFATTERPNDRCSGCAGCSPVRR
jgi:hypothetical protein